MNETPAPIPRLCVLTKPNGEYEYGFNLHAERGRGQFVGAVDRGSAADMAGLRPGDHIVAVNGESIEGLSHKEVVQRIKFDPVRCSLLVLDEEGVLWFKEHNVPLTAEYLLRRLKGPPEGGVAAGDRHVYILEEQQQENDGTQNEVAVDVPPSAHSPTSENSEPAADPALISSLQISPKPVQQQYSSPSSAPSESSPSAAAIGRHVAVPLPPPGTLLANGPKPRLCSLHKASPIEEFGFNLHAEKGKGHFIGAVDKDGIADRAGLETGQRIVGVNGRLVFPNSPHKEIVQLIKRDPLRTELLVASEEVDRFYAEYALSFSYEHAIVFDPSTVRNGGGAIPPSKQTARLKNSNGAAPASNKQQQQQPMERQRRTSSNSTASTVEERKQQQQKLLMNEIQQRRAMAAQGTEAGAGAIAAAIGQRPPTPTSTYTQQNGTTTTPTATTSADFAAAPAATSATTMKTVVAVQIERRPDNRTSIAIGELEEANADEGIPRRQTETATTAEEQPMIVGIGTPPNSRCDEKFSSGEEEKAPEHPDSTKQLKREQPVAVDEARQQKKHVIADSSPSPTSPPPPSIAPPKPQKRHSPPAILQPLSIVPPYPQQQQKQQFDKTSPLSMESHGSYDEKRDFGNSNSTDIFALNAKEARKAICGRKRDPRLEGHMTMEEKHRLLLNL